MVCKLDFVNGRFGFLRKYNELWRLLSEVRELAHDYGIECVEVKVVTDQEYGEEDV
ncbi:MAG: hypothetical protein VB081_03205 [Christensenella sp.]|uniref:hypothetical protein n=1 Tax=Christensenella sp. TaxID=1935934 RepID=UPI002B216180|nr:hypothetical protein [Christensenella sp.]MEA5002484.1 hypothetical protein [Christensenella sp.]